MYQRRLKRLPNRRPKSSPLSANPFSPIWFAPCWPACTSGYPSPDFHNWRHTGDSGTVCGAAGDGRLLRLRSELCRFRWR
jgi:hypothetical protein